MIELCTTIGAWPLPLQLVAVVILGGIAIGCALVLMLFVSLLAAAFLE